jgi:hypothetical protein
VPTKTRRNKWGRSREVLGLHAAGHNVDRIAYVLRTSPNTVRQILRAAGIEQEKQLKLTDHDERKPNSMDDAQKQAAKEYLAQKSADQDEQIAALKQQIQALQAQQGAITLEQAEERLDKLTEDNGIERRARARGISSGAAFDELCEEAYEPWARYRRRQQELEALSAERSLARELEG